MKVIIKGLGALLDDLGLPMETEMRKKILMDGIFYISGFLQINAMRGGMHEVGCDKFPTVSAASSSLLSASALGVVSADLNRRRSSSAVPVGFAASSCISLICNFIADKATGMRSNALGVSYVAIDRWGVWFPVWRRYVLTRDQFGLSNSFSAAASDCSECRAARRKPAY
ncbi:hypothetical protein EAG_09908 [Camponotus floridanus]|uniref:Uncharacterized protein n=1 Tax=Camponotus floridanus TaxID=104421 RepID=E2A6D3_CAMFO|nr:hypothetical protein EAG_09908 [Camponotus floridanus]